MTILQTIEAFKRELTKLQLRYVQELASIAERARLGIEDAEVRDHFSTHTPFNLAANCQNLQELAAKIDATKTTLRTLEEVVS